MNVVPAQIAGVGSLVVASPPQKNFGGLPHPTILAAAQLLGIGDFLRMLPELSRRRAWLQERRKRRDAEIIERFRLG